MTDINPAMQEEMMRLSFDIPEDLYNRLKGVVPWGARSRFLRELIEIAVNRIERGGPQVIGAIMIGDLDPFRKVE